MTSVLLSNLQISPNKYMKYYIHDCCPHLDEAMVLKKRGRKSLKCMFQSQVSAQLEVQQCQMWVQWPLEGRDLLTDRLFLTIWVFDVLRLVRFKGKKPTHVTLVELPPRVVSSRPIFSKRELPGTSANQVAPPNSLTCERCCLSLRAPDWNFQILVLLLLLQRRPAFTHLNDKRCEGTTEWQKGKTPQREIERVPQSATRGSTF